MKISTWDRIWKQSVELTERRYPQMKNHKSKLWKAVSNNLELIIKDDSHLLYGKPDCVLLLAEICAKTLSVK